MQIKILCSVEIFLGIFCIVAISVLLSSGYNDHVVLSAVKPRHGEITTIPKNMERYKPFIINDVTFIDSWQFMLFSLTYYPATWAKTNTRKYLGSLYVQQPNQPQINNVTESGEEGEIMHVHEDYENQP